MGFSLDMVMNVTVFGACAVSFAMQMLRRDPPKAANTENLNEAVSRRDYEETAEPLGGKQEKRNTLEQLEAVKAAKMVIEIEIETEKSRIQTEQGKETADAAVKVLQVAAKNVEFNEKLVKRSTSSKRKRHALLPRVGTLFKKKFCV